MAAEILGCHTKKLDRNTIMVWITKCKPHPSRYIENIQGSGWRSCTIDRAETKGETMLTKPSQVGNAVRVFQCLYRETGNRRGERGDPT